MDAVHARRAIDIAGPQAASRVSEARAIVDPQASGVGMGSAGSAGRRGGFPPGFVDEVARLIQVRRG